MGVGKMSGSYQLVWDDRKRTDLFTGYLQSRGAGDMFADVTLVSEDFKPFNVHRLVLASCSSFFRRLLEIPGTGQQQQVLVHLPGVISCDLARIIEFVYAGSANVPQQDMDNFMATATRLAVQGLVVGDSAEDPLAQEITVQKKRKYTKTGKYSKQTKTEKLSQNDTNKMTVEEENVVDVEFLKKDYPGLTVTPAEENFLSTKSDRGRRKTGTTTVNKSKTEGLNQKIELKECDVVLSNVSVKEEDKKPSETEEKKDDKVEVFRKLNPNLNIKEIIEEKQANNVESAPKRRGRPPKKNSSIGNNPVTKGVSAELSQSKIDASPEKTESKEKDELIEEITKNYSPENIQKAFDTYQQRQLNEKNNVEQKQYSTQRKFSCSECEFQTDIEENLVRHKTGFHKTGDNITVSIIEDKSKDE